MAHVPCEGGEAPLAEVDSEEESAPVACRQRGRSDSFAGAAGSPDAAVCQANNVLVTTPVRSGTQSSPFRRLGTVEVATSHGPYTAAAPERLARTHVLAQGAP